MRIGLASFRCENRNIPFNLGQMERAMASARGRADLLCFGEAFLQGFDALCWDYAADRQLAVSQDSGTMGQLRRLTRQYGMALLFGYIESEGDGLYSSCAVLADGEILHNYRRISRGWKEYDRTDGHYREGSSTGSFRLRGTDLALALCGDLFDAPERFRTDRTLLWPVYVNYGLEDWADGVLEEYAAQAALVSPDVLMVNPIDRDPVNHGGAFRFRNGQVAARIPFDEEGILYAEVE